MALYEEFINLKLKDYANGTPYATDSTAAAMMNWWEGVPQNGWWEGDRWEICDTGKALNPDIYFSGIWWFHQISGLGPSRLKPSEAGMKDYVQLEQAADW